MGKARPRYGPTETLPSLKPESFHLPRYPILSSQEPQKLRGRGLHAEAQLRSAGVGGVLSLWLMPCRQSSCKLHLEAFHVPVALTYTEPPAQVQTRTGLLPVLSMPACNVLEDTFMASTPNTVSLIQTPYTKKVGECAEGVYWSPLCTQPLKTVLRDKWSYRCRARSLLHLPPHLYI